MSKKTAVREVREINSLDNHIIVDGGTAVIDNKTVVVKGNGWTLTIDQDQIVAQPDGFLKPLDIKSTKPKAKAKPNAKKANRKARTTRSAGRDALVIKLLSEGEKYKTITQRTGYSGGTISRVRAQHVATNAQTPATTTPTKPTTVKSRSRRGYSRKPALDEIETRVVEHYINAHPGRRDKAIAEHFGVSKSTIGRVRAGLYCHQLHRQ